ncbi:hypothetical protein GF323_02115 [Candidatus Woesearchaeota archaeon]|nr:hypothetical protein [Candidatus Woesearchaeota archaeon]
MKSPLVIVLILSLLLLACTAEKETEQARQEAMQEFQETACNSADEAGTCHKLKALGIITKEQCCERMNKCCE